MLKGYESDHAMAVWAMHVMLLCLLAYCGCIEHHALFGIVLSCDSIHDMINVQEITFAQFRIT